MQNGSSVAIKRFSPLHVNLDRRKILKEIGTLSKLRHPNLAPIRGWCVENKEMVLIYEYMSNGSLDKWLFARGVLPWARRFKVVKDIAEALCFLHHGWDRNLLHKNVKISNVLLDITFTAVLGDFGLIHNSSPNSQDSSSNGKSLVGALDEIDQEQNLRAPETSYLEIPNEKIDVFGFGVIVLEILSGRRSLDQNRPKQEIDLVAWAWNLQENGRLIQLVDRRLRVTYNPEQAICLSIIGLLCTLDDPRMRPSMQEVIWYIKGEKSLPALPSRRPTTCFLYPSTTELCNLYSCSPSKKISFFGSSRK